ncbi:hypothetical protein ZWY2020_030672 [Hordeum vulgare]|nr:hypothetical protein ZWY2020_030672 [Hordeum vulgare]
MDLSRPESSDLSLGLHPHAHANAHARAHARAATPLRLFDDSDDVKTEGSVGGGGGGDGENGDDEGADQHFSLLGHSLCVKRPRNALYGGGGGEASSCSSSSAAMRPAKRQAAGADLEARRRAVRAWGNEPLAEADPDVHALMERERDRQVRGIELIASENFVCRAVLDALGSHLTNNGLVAAKECRSPFDYCDVVTSTTHKNLRGPRGGIIFFRKGKNMRKRGGSFSQGDENDYDFEDKINFAVFPSLQGGPHNNHIAALAITLKQVATPEYKAYIQQVMKNAQALASALLRRKCRLVTGGTDNHLVLWDLRTFGLTGKNFEKVCELCHISINKTPIYGDNGSISPGGVRIGTPAMTTRGCLEDDFEVIADFLIRATQIAGSVLKQHGKVQKEFLRGLENNKDIIELGNQVEAFASQFAMPGFDVVHTELEVVALNSNGVENDFLVGNWFRLFDSQAIMYRSIS